MDDMAPFGNLRAMTLVAGICCMHRVQDRDDLGKRPLEDVIETEDPACS